MIRYELLEILYAEGTVIAATSTKPGYEEVDLAVDDMGLTEALSSGVGALLEDGWRLVCQSFVGPNVVKIFERPYPQE